MPRIATHTPLSAQADHAALIVALDAGDLQGVERDRAGGLIATCDGCAELLADLAAIRAATAALPAPLRTRDFRLTDADAARLRPTFRSRLLGWLAAPGSSVRPLAGGLAALGIAGLLLATTPGILSPGSVALVTEAATAVPATARDERLAAPDAVPPGAAAGAGQNAQPSPEPRPAFSTVPKVEACVAPTAAASAAAPAGHNDTTAACAPSSSEPVRAAAVPGPAVGATGTTDAAASPSTAFGPALLPVPAASAATGSSGYSAASGAGAAPAAAPGAAAPPSAAPSSPPATDRGPLVALSVVLLAAGLLLVAGRVFVRRTLR